MRLGELASLACGADVLVRDQFRVKAGESVLITADPETSVPTVEALVTATRLVGGKCMVAIVPRLPFTGSLADACIPEPASAAALSADVWFDLTFPSFNGSSTYAAMLKNGRTRHALLGDLGEGLRRLYAAVNFDALYELQSAIDSFIRDSEGESCHISSAAGTDCVFRIGKSATKKSRVVDQPGSQTPPGSALILPVPESVQGTLVLEATFDSSYTPLTSPVTMEVDNRIRKVQGEGRDTAVLDRALRRAGGGEYGQVIHFTHGFHPAATFTGRAFMEDIRSMGCNAVGLGIPWWVPGGGENHPDGVIRSQSIRIGKQLIVDNGVLVGPDNIARMASALEPRHC